MSTPDLRILFAAALAVSLMWPGSAQADEPPTALQSLGSTAIATKLRPARGAPNFEAHLEAGDIAILPDGTLLTCWIDADADSPFGDIRVAESTDRGATFSSPVTIMPMPGSDFQFSRPLRFAVAPDGSVMLAGLGHRLLEDGDASAVQVFRRASPDAEWQPMHGFFEDFGGDTIRFESMIAVEDGALLLMSGTLPNSPDEADEPEQSHTWGWWLRDGRSQLIRLPDLLANGCDEAVLWVRGSTIDLFARPLEGRSIWRTSVTLPAMQVGLLNEFHRTEPGRALILDSLYQSPSGHATLACSERWEDAAALAASEESDDPIAWMSAVHRERIIYVGAQDGTFGIPLRTVGSDAGRTAARVRVLPLSDGWLEVRSRVQLVPEITLGIDLYGLDGHGMETGLTTLWEDLNGNPWYWHRSAPVVFSDGTGAIAMYNLDWNEQPAVETWTLLRFAPSTSPTE